MSKPPSSEAGGSQSSRFAPYRQALQAISTRTGTALPSLVISFGLLHELTAIVPIVGFFYGARALGIGERVVQAITAEEDGSNGWAKQKCRDWVDEGSQWAQRVGRRYGVFGYERRDRNAEVDQTAATRTSVDGDISTRLAGDAANAILAYGLTKAGCLRLAETLIAHSVALQALLPVRIGLSLYLSPPFARKVVDPIQSSILRLFRRDPRR